MGLALDTQLEESLMERVQISKHLCPFVSCRNFSDFDINVNCVFQLYLISVSFVKDIDNTIRKNWLILILILLLFLFSNIMKQVNCVECIRWMGLMHHDTILYLYQAYPCTLWSLPRQYSLHTIVVHATLYYTKPRDAYHGVYQQVNGFIAYNFIKHTILIQFHADTSPYWYNT